MKKLLLIAAVYGFVTMPLMADTYKQVNFRQVQNTTTGALSQSICSPGIFYHTADYPSCIDPNAAFQQLNGWQLWVPMKSENVSSDYESVCEQQWYVCNAIPKPRINCGPMLKWQVFAMPGLAYLGQSSTLGGPISAIQKVSFSCPSPTSVPTSSTTSTTATTPTSTPLPSTRTAVPPSRSPTSTTFPCLRLPCDPVPTASVPTPTMVAFLTATPTVAASATPTPSATAVPTTIPATSVPSPSPSSIPVTLTPGRVPPVVTRTRPVPVTLSPRPSGTTLGPFPTSTATATFTAPTSTITPIASPKPATTSDKAAGLGLLVAGIGTLVYKARVWLAVKWQYLKSIWK